jgi:hypothetical protein
MPNYLYGNMFDHVGDYDLFLVTTNSYIKKDGTLVMGRGAAKEAAKKWPHLPKALGDTILPLGTYGVRVTDDHSSSPTRLGAFQVKRHWHDNANLDLIALSCIKLTEYGEIKIALNFPGIGNGGLDQEKVKPILDRILPSNIDIWQFQQ